MCFADFLHSHKTKSLSFSEIPAGPSAEKWWHGAEATWTETKEGQFTLTASWTTFGVGQVSQTQFCFENNIGWEIRESVLLIDSGGRAGEPLPRLLADCAVDRAIHHLSSCVLRRYALRTSAFFNGSSESVCHALQFVVLRTFFLRFETQKGQGFFWEARIFVFVTKSQFLLTCCSLFMDSSRPLPGWNWSTLLFCVAVTNNFLRSCSFAGTEHFYNAQRSQQVVGSVCWRLIEVFSTNLLEFWQQNVMRCLLFGKHWISCLTNTGRVCTRDKKRTVWQQCGPSGHKSFASDVRTAAISWTSLQRKRCAALGESSLFSLVVATFQASTTRWISVQNLPQRMKTTTISMSIRL